MSKSKPEEIKVTKRLEVKRFTIKSFGVSTNLRTGLTAPTATCECCIGTNQNNCNTGTANTGPAYCKKSAVPYP